MKYSIDFFYKDELVDRLENCYKDSERRYHTWKHVQSMLQFLDGNTEFNKNLFWAVLAHDAVYDSKTNKELRSYECLADIVKRSSFRFYFSDKDLEEIHNLIALTVHHKLPRYPSESEFYMVAADLHELSKADATIRNWYLLNEEAQALYKISSSEAASTSAVFLKALYRRMLDNEKQFRLFDETELFNDIMKGIELSVEISEKAS